MSKILKQRATTLPPRALRQDSPPVSVVFRDGQFAHIEFKDRMMAEGACIRCSDLPCMEYSEDELRVPGFEDFPADMNYDVCPTVAISISEEKAAPVVDAERCISCGLCASRCPVGAIRLDPKLGAMVNDKADNKVFPPTNSPEEVLRSRNLLSTATRKGRLLTENDKTISMVMEKIEAIGDVTTQFPNHLSRNLLLAVGLQAAMRRRGDVYLRMDLVFSNGVGEVEFMRQALLDSPRNVLDNIAVVVSRYGKRKNELTPLIVSTGLPNKRTEYWQVINDVEGVLGIRIRSVTVGALCLLVWSGQRLRFNKNLLYTPPGTFSIRSDIEWIIGRSVQISDGHYGLLENSK